MNEQKEHSSESLRPVWTSRAKSQELLASVNEAIDVLKSLGAHPRPNGSLMSIFSSVRKLAEKSDQLSDERWEEYFEKATEARRIVMAILAAADDPNSRRNFAAIVSSDMNAKATVSSEGRNLLWELDLYRRIKIGGAGVYIGEPDLVLSLGEDQQEYSIACKKTHVESGVDGALRDGACQIKKQGRPGIIAFNLDTLAARRQWNFADEEDLGKALRRFNDVFIDRHKQTFMNFAGREQCDGVLISTSVYAKVFSSNLPRKHCSAMAILPLSSESKGLNRLESLRRIVDQIR